MTRGERAVELVGEGQRAGVGDRELHRDDCGDVVLQEAGGDAGERVLRRSLGGFAGVEHSQAQAAATAEQRAELLATDAMRTPVFALEDETAFAAVVVVLAVADVVKDVEVLAVVSLLL